MATTAFEVCIVETVRQIYGTSVPSNTLQVGGGRGQICGTSMPANTLQVGGGGGQVYGTSVPANALQVGLTVGLHCF